MTVESARAIVNRAAVIALSIVVATILAGLLLLAVDEIQAARIARLDATEVVEYASIDWSGDTDRDGNLIMVSLTQWHRHADRVVWIDRLLCSELPRQPIVVSSQLAERGGVGPTDLEQVEWVYAGFVPAGSPTCRISSSITATVGGVDFEQTVESNPFQPPPEGNRS